MKSSEKTPNKSESGAQTTSSDSKDSKHENTGSSTHGSSSLFSSAGNNSASTSVPFSVEEIEQLRIVCRGDTLPEWLTCAQLQTYKPGTSIDEAVKNLTEDQMKDIRDMLKAVFQEELFPRVLVVNSIPRGSR